MVQDTILTHTVTPNSGRLSECSGLIPADLAGHEDTAAMTVDLGRKMNAHNAALGSRESSFIVFCLDSNFYVNITSQFPCFP